MAEFSSGKVTIEIATDRNNSVLFPPTKTKLRGRQDRNNWTPDERSRKIENFPTIPGMRIKLEWRGGKGTGTIYDPLSKNKEELERLQTVVRGVLNMECGAEQDQEWSLTETGVKTWLYWMRRLMDGAPVQTNRFTGRTSGGPFAVEYEGRVPTLEEIEKMPGKIEKSQFASMFIESRTREVEAVPA